MSKFAIAEKDAWPTSAITILSSEITKFFAEPETYEAL
jgi:hypothetical protein